MNSLFEMLSLQFCLLEIPVTFEELCVLAGFVPVATTTSASSQFAFL